MDKGNVTGTVFLELSKAFDTIDHELLGKLSNLGFSDGTVAWFRSYLGFRKQVTVVGDVSSSSKYVSVGVPRGSVLGPLLFVIYINDLPSCARFCEISLHADDTLLFSIQYECP